MIRLSRKLDQLTRVKQGETVLAVGVFDLFHAGHVNLLKSARAMGGRLVVIINGDRLTSSYKRPPIMNENDRLVVLQACRYVDHAEVSNEYSIRKLVIRYGVTKIVHGDDWEATSYMRQICCDDDFLRDNNVELILIPYTPGVSASDIILSCARLASTFGKRERNVATNDAAD